MTREQKIAIAKAVTITVGTVATVVVARLGVNKILCDAFLTDEQKNAN